MLEQYTVWHRLASPGIARQHEVSAREPSEDKGKAERGFYFEL
jgi:hypothetical protein